MPGCSVTREVVGSTAEYVINGKFEGACAWDLSRRIGSEPLCDVVIDFSQVNEFVDYGVAVVANALLTQSPKRFRLLGLRQHQARLFRYFGVDPEELARGTERTTTAPDGIASLPAAASEVH
jgi:hypothetical protein